MNRRAEHHATVVGLDSGSTTNSATVMDAARRYLVDHLVETSSRVQKGPDKAIDALADAFAQIFALTDTPSRSVAAVGLDTRVSPAWMV